MAKYPLTELGHVAKDFQEKHRASFSTFSEMADAVTAATGLEIKESSFQQMRRDERGFSPHRKTIMDFMRERDPALVDASLATYAEMYCRKEA